MMLVIKQVPERKERFCFVDLNVAGWARLARLHVADDARLADWRDGGQQVVKIVSLKKNLRKKFTHKNEDTPRQ